jgi:hypothetical protein
MSAIHPMFVPESLPAASRWSAWQELAVLSLIGMEMTGTALWLRILSQTGSSVSFGLAWITLVSVAVMTYFLSRLTAILRLKLSLRRGVLLAWLFVSIYLILRIFLAGGEPLRILDAANGIIRSVSLATRVFPSELILTLGALWVVWRAVVLAEQPFEYSVASGRFAAGIFWVAAYSLISPYTGESPLAAIYLLILCGLLSLGLARIHSLQFLRGSRKIPFTRSWLGGIAGSVAVVVGLAAFSGFLMASWGADAIGWLTLAALRMIIIGGSLLFLPLLALFMQLGPLLQELARLFPEIADQILNVLGGIQRMIEGLAAGFKHDLALPENTGPIFIWAIFILGVFILLLTLRARDNRRKSAELIESEELQNTGLLHSLLGRIRAIQHRLGMNPGGQRIGQLIAKARIRRIYAQLMSLSAALGLPRAQAQTPLEFLPAMQALFPENPEDLAVITRAYMLVRYGELPEDEEDLIAVETAWQQLNKAGRSLKQMKPKGKGSK